MRFFEVADEDKKNIFFVIQKYFWRLYWSMIVGGFFTFIGYSCYEYIFSVSSHVEKLRMGRVIQFVIYSNCFFWYLVWREKRENAKYFYL